MGFMLDIRDTEHNLGTDHFDVDDVKELGWYEVALEGPIDTAPIREWLLENINEGHFLYREIFACCNAWFLKEEDAVLFKSVWG